MTYKVGMNMSQAMQAARESKWTGEHNRASQVEARIESFFKNDKDGIISDDKELKKFNEFIDSTPYDPNLPREGKEYGYAPLLSQTIYLNICLKPFNIKTFRYM